MNLPEASQDAILSNANLSIVTWKGASGQMPFLEDFFRSVASVLISGEVFCFG